jgi:GWxTD domain-containing protein
MRRFTLPLAVVALVSASFAAAELSPAYKDWPNGPAGFLMTSAEREAYAGLKTDADAKAFVDLFFAKRDKNLGAVNQFKLDFDARVEAADQQFSTPKLKGSLSDRGQVLIVLGKPLKRMIVATPGNEDRDEMLQRGKREEWLYTADGNPPSKHNPEYMFVFQETHPGLGDYPFDRSDTHTKTALKFLDERLKELIVHPDLTEAPRPGLVPGSKAATKEQLAVFDGAQKWPEGARIFAVCGVQSNLIHPIWVFVQLPDAVAPATEAIGRVRSADGTKTEGSFGGVAVTPVSLSGARAYEFSLPVMGAAEWKVDIALLDASGPIAVKSVDAKTEATPAEGPYISPIYWGGDVRQEAQAHLGDPFNVGGWHIIPRLDGHYTKEEELSYFGSIIRPGLDAQGKPDVNLTMTLYVNGKKADENTTPLSLSHIPNTDIWMFGSQIPMSGFRPGVGFELGLTVTDTVGKASRAVRFPFEINKPVAPPAPAAAAPAATPAPKH